ncbi:protein tyrosine phosphatase [Bracoviriform indiense]|uniref:Protein tyrosine phosphatase n=1 Tax=Bracoviriform indiense TaxID=116759 RepID=B8PQ56_9VIRU|nr:protein tyrosine phosphatase [Bracoviriform indiense]ACE75482.1 protein tyrosine phosphatase [Bracoviriform indiense]
MEDSSFKTLSAAELLEMTSNRKFCKLIRQEHREVMEVPLRGTTSQSLTEENSSKNRYSNIPCWDHSLVIIDSRESLIFDEEDWDSSRRVRTSEANASTYIHANHVDGYENINKYICAQTPMENTWETFFKLIWEQQSSVIVSLTDMDRDNPKSYQLWMNPEGSETTFGIYVITILDIKKKLSFTRTQVEITNTSTETSREITNFWFTDWPDISIPTGMEEFLDLRKEVNREQSQLIKKAENDSQTPGPIVVHCSTGTGWAGTFCAIDNALEQLDKEERVSVSQIVLKIRSQRHSSVFLPEQYEFCYLVLRHVLLEKAKDEQLD